MTEDDPCGLRRLGYRNDVLFNILPRPVARGEYHKLGRTLISPDTAKAILPHLDTTPGKTVNLSTEGQTKQCNCGCNRPPQSSLAHWASVDRKRIKPNIDSPAPGYMVPDRWKTEYKDNFIHPMSYLRAIPDYHAYRFIPRG